MFQIVSGEVRQCILTADGQEVLIYIYKPGDVIGDSSVVDEEPYSVTYITRGESVLRVWKARDFNDLRATHHEVESAVAAQISRRLRSVLRMLEELLTQPVAARCPDAYPGLPRRVERSTAKSTADRVYTTYHRMG
ncbi:Crp/Fnr family transcriptional regulator [Pseudomonas aeruginosa]|uniref:Crp/Fnr family transcriptional regulator n=1 Tax=Pseudomonas extremaustralis TaxID=359110 RepID=UPI001C109B03|nr:Crp/Fnr family transcriptional regulator [Pseudomonas aeruginosa]MBU5733082.1 Crp/Fnr family transcriptional regulator [Pseudomonas aeruginosa]HDQ4470819.1 Crp/Fnr family transcriptional regulator [Pseudomonas aeruginosa]